MGEVETIWNAIDPTARVELQAVASKTEFGVVKGGRRPTRDQPPAGVKNRGPRRDGRGTTNKPTNTNDRGAYT